MWLTQSAKLLLWPAVVTSKHLTSETYTTSGFEIAANMTLKLCRTGQGCTRTAYWFQLRVNGWEKVKMTWNWRNIISRKFCIMEFCFNAPLKSIPWTASFAHASSQNWMKKLRLLFSCALFFFKGSVHEKLSYIDIWIQYWYLSVFQFVKHFCFLEQRTSKSMGLVNATIWF